MGHVPRATHRLPVVLLAALLVGLAALAAVAVPAAQAAKERRSAKAAPTSRSALCLTARTAPRVATSRSARTGRASSRSGGCRAALPVVPGAADPARQRTLVLGANVRGWRDGGAITQALDVAKSDGTRTTRVDVSWTDAEPQRGTFDFAAYDARFEALAGAGMSAVVLLDGTAPWAGAESDYAADPAGFARFTAATVARYGRGGTFWAEHPELDADLAPTWFELWNEPYYSASSAGRRSPEAYGRLAEAAIAAGKAADPGAKFLVAGDTVVYDDVEGRWRNWFSALFQETPGLRKAVDGIALHPYFEGDPDDYAPRSSRFHGQFLRLDEIRRQLRSQRLGDLPWFVTELGSATCRDRSSDDKCTTERGQAANLRETLAILRTRYAANARMVLAYRAEDLDYGDRGGAYDALGSFGMRRLDGSAKPVLSVYRRALGA